MSHTNSTAHYGLPQFVSTDKPTYLGDSNSAYLAIDNGINAAQAKADGADAKATENAGKITQLQADLTQTNQQVSTVQQIANNANSTAISANDLANAISEEGAIGTSNLANKAVTSEKIDWTTLTQLISQSDINSAGGSLVFGDVLIQWGSYFWGNLNTSASGFNTTTITLPKNYANVNYVAMAFQMYDTGNIAGGETKVVSRKVNSFNVNYSHIVQIVGDSTRIGWLAIGQKA